MSLLNQIPETGSLTTLEEAVRFSSASNLEVLFSKLSHSQRIKYLKVKSCNDETLIHSLAEHYSDSYRKAQALLKGIPEADLQGIYKVKDDNDVSVKDYLEILKASAKQ